MYNQLLLKHKQVQAVPDISKVSPLQLFAQTSSCNIFILTKTTVNKYFIQILLKSTRLYNVLTFCFYDGPF